MITASEPLEFIPRGRKAVDEHPGPLINKQANITSENILLNRLQNVCISNENKPKEFWLINELYKNFYLVKKKQQINNNVPHCLNDYYVNSEEELYIKGNTAVWTKGLLSEDYIPPQICLTCESPIKFAFFCPKSFINYKLNSKIIFNDILIDSHDDDEDDANIGICLIDSTSLRIYCTDGENYVTSLEFPLLNIFVTKHCILLEKEQSSTTINSHEILLPRLFSITHPLDEMSPILIKTSTGQLSYFIDNDYKIVFADKMHNIILLYETKNGKHFICKMRYASEEEINITKNLNNKNQNNETASNFNMNSTACSYNMSCNNSLRISGCNRQQTSASSLKNFQCTTNTASPYGNSFNKSQVYSPLMRLQTTISQQLNQLTINDMRKIGQAQPSKPIIPEFCFEQIWLENLANKSYDYFEMADYGFIHENINNDKFICFLLKKNFKLNLVSYNIDKEVTFGPVTYTIPAKDAVCLNKINMIAVLAPCGTLMLYTGHLLIGKLHISGILTSLTTPINLRDSLTSSFPRRSSLLPTVIPNELNFEEELHLLSPVHPLQTQFPSRLTGQCINIRDGVGNRLTLVYPSDIMFRIKLPKMCDSVLVKKCLSAIHNVLDKNISLTVYIKWYGLRNAPGSQNLTTQQEWIMFKTLFYELLGRPFYNDDYIDVNMPTSIEDSEASSVNNSFEPKKRRKTSFSSGTDSDWEYLLKYNNNNLNTVHSDTVQECQYIINDNTILYQYLPMVFMSFHLLYEESKLNINFIDNNNKSIENLLILLYELSIDLKLDNYQYYYVHDYPKLLSLVNSKNKKYISIENFQKFIDYNIINPQHALIPSIYKFIYEKLQNNDDLSRFPYIMNINTTSKNIIEIVRIICGKPDYTFVLPLKTYNSLTNNNTETFITSTSAFFNDEQFKKSSMPEQVVKLLLELEITREDIEKLPFSIHFLISQTIEECRSKSLNIYKNNSEAYKLLLRPDLVSHTLYDNKENNDLLNSDKDIIKENSISPRIVPTPDIITKTDNSQDEDGMENTDTKLLRLRFPNDLRINEVRKLLNTSTPVVIDIVQSPGVTDHDFIEEQEKQLFALIIRSMALPIGRGMFTLRTCKPNSTESLPIPKLCLTGRDIQRNINIEIQQIETPTNMSMWPVFHNGVAAGLKIMPDSKDIDSTWIVYNKPKGTTETSYEHAGFLMALGLNGHLRELSYISIYEYLIKCDEITSVGLLLGISAAYKGTMDTQMTKILSVHIESLLPATALELDIPQNMQIAALMGVGLVYQGTAKRHIAEILLQEIGRPPGPEMENSVDRESYSLTAGLALGLVTLGKGETTTGLCDLYLPDALHYYMIGGNKRPLTGSQKDKYKLSSFQIREGDTVNIDVTSPGATLALGLMFYRTGNKSVAAWMSAPDTKYLLDFVRPDLLLLRIIAKGLILWDDIEPTDEWLNKQFPTLPYYDAKDKAHPDFGNDDPELHCQAYCNIIAGASFCIGLRYAGTENMDAYNILKKNLHIFLNAKSGQYLSDTGGKLSVESCLVIVLLSLSLVFAGSGNLNILRIIRMLRSRIGQSNCHVSYGSHMAIHMALGFLFLGAGRFTLSRTPFSIAILVCALFPKFPIYSTDNRYHLQAFRHLYVLAIEPRLFLPRDIDSGKLTMCYLSYVKLGSTEIITSPMAPCMLPELDTLKSVFINDTNYWPVYFDRDRNWDQLEFVLKNSLCIDIKQRTGSIANLDNYEKLITNKLRYEKYLTWKINYNIIEKITNNINLLIFIKKFLIQNNTNLVDNINIDNLYENNIIQMLLIEFYNCLTKDKIHALPIYISMLMSLQHLYKTNNSNDIWQFKILKTIIEKSEKRINSIDDNNIYNQLLISNEIVKSIILKLNNYFINMKKKHNYKNELKFILYNSQMNFIDNYIIKNAINGKIDLTSFIDLNALVIYYDIPYNITNLLYQISNDKNNYINYLCNLKSFYSHTIDMIFQILKDNNEIC